VDFVAYSVMKVVHELGQCIYLNGAVLAIVVCPSVCLSHASIVSKFKMAEHSIMQAGTLVC